MGEIGIGLLGCGVVGSATARALVEDADRLSHVLGRRPAIRAVAVRYLDKPRDVPLDRTLFTDDPAAVVEREDVDVIVELIGGVNPAGGLVELALHEGKPVVTANKELLARRGDCLRRLAVARGRPLLAEGAVMAGVPVLAPLRTLAASDRIERLQGVLNGTTNYCLHRMEEDGLTLEQSLDEARALGYTELDPSSDVDGRDAAAKLAVLATLAFGATVSLGDVDFAGIRGIGPEDLRRARREGRALRLVAEAWPADGGVFARVAPRDLPEDHPLVQVKDHHNGLLARCRLAGDLLFRGPGAGGEATASAVLSDLVRAFHDPAPARTIDTQGGLAHV